jgi:hypothetical protein
MQDMMNWRCPLGIFGGKGGNFYIKKTMPHRGPTQFVSIEPLILIIGSEYDHDVDSQIMHMVRYGTQPLIVDNVDKTWQIHGIHSSRC